MMLLIRWLSRRLRARPRNGPKGPLSLVAHQLHYNLIPLTRNRQGGLVAAIGFPVIFLVLFVGVFGNHPVGTDHVKAATYYVPGIAVLAVVVASFTNLVTALVSQRESGILRRRRATPVPAQILIAAQAVTTLLVSLAGVAVLLGIGRVAYGVTLHAAAVPGVLLTTLVGSVACSCLAYALSTAIASVDSATPTVQAISLPLYFISGVFIPNADLPPWLQQVAKAFPVQHLADGLHHAFDPAVHGGAMAWTDLAVLAAWGAAGLAVALGRFSWAPSAATATPAGRRPARAGAATPPGSVGDPEPGSTDTVVLARPCLGGRGGGATVPIGHDHDVGWFDAGHCQACAREAGLLDHYRRVQRDEARLWQAWRWARTARRWAGWALLVAAAGVVLALVSLLSR